MFTFTFSEIMCIWPFLTCFSRLLGCNYDPVTPIPPEPLVGKICVHNRIADFTSYILIPGQQVWRQNIRPL